MTNIGSSCWLFIISLYSFAMFGQTIPSDKIIAISELGAYLKDEVKTEFKNNSNINLATYFRDKFAERYFYDWKDVDSKFEVYKDLYSNSEATHKERAFDHMSKFSANTKWKLPFNYTDGSALNAYAIRHLARQHKMVDIAFQYFYKDKDPKYIEYFKDQQRSLNAALLNKQFETVEDGNGVYEVFRSGYRILNWLQIHNMFLGETHYSDDDQLLTIATLLQHGANLYENNTEFTPGNHQTRGMSALAMLSILFREFKDADAWFERSMELLKIHLEKEINADGFQFERTVHYHMSDIDNYYYVYQLANNSALKLDEFWNLKFESLFTTLIKIAYPDKSAPVLSDDTDAPWAEKNDISGALTLGYLLFENPEMGYFANEKVNSKMFWYLDKTQLDLLKGVQFQKPTLGSFAFDDTGYYIMREGWNKNDRMLIVSAGLDAHKPDHQHGDMLGIQAMANGKVILPNYQVRYSLEDLELFKNSMTKNVALVDDELQGKEYKSNKGGSGFGKFGKLPNPKTLVWKTNHITDVYIGTHDGFNDVGVSYSRQIIDNKEGGFWIIKDNFSSDKIHDYKQVWQGHYSFENAPNLLRATFDDGSGLDVLQLYEVDDFYSNGARGKHWSVLSKNRRNKFSFLTVVYPFSKFDQRIDENLKKSEINGWIVNGDDISRNTLATVISKNNHVYAFAVSRLNYLDTEITFATEADVLIAFEDRNITILSLSKEQILLNSVKNNSIRYELQPGETYSYQIEE